MSAYNWIDIKGRCPICEKAGTLKFQTHMASSYDGEEDQRFHDNNYQAGDKMEWFDEHDERYGSWKNGNSRNPTANNTSLECCMVLAGYVMQHVTLLSFSKNV